MNRKFLAILLCLSMMIGLSVPIYAAETTVQTGAELLEAINNAADGAIIKLQGECEVDQTIKIENKEVTLDLNGYMLRYTGSGGAVIEVGDGGNLTIIDSNGAQKVHTFNHPSDAAWSYQSSADGSTEDVANGKIAGGVITGGTDSGVYIHDNSAVTMLGGSIVGCKGGAKHQGGGMSISGDRSSSRSLTMSGKARIIGCRSQDSGGGIYSGGPYSTITMNDDAAILYCHADYSCGAIFMWNTSALFIMNGGRISDCTAGKGKIVNLSGNMHANGGVIDGDVLIDGSISVEAGETGTTFNRSASFTGGCEGGIFKGPVTNKGTIYNGIFEGPVENWNLISGGEFRGDVTDITYDNPPVRHWGKITDGTFYGKVIHNAKPEHITGGTFLGGIEGNAPANALTVTFDENGGSPAPNTISPQTVVGDTKLIKPGDPTKSGCTFGGWFYEDRSQLWNFAQSADANGITWTGQEIKITLTAAWGYDVSFDGNGGSGTTSLWVKEGEKITKPADPTRAGYTFGGWTYNGTPWDFSQVVSEHMQLVASWDEVKSDSGSSGSSRPHRYSISMLRDLTGGKISVSPSRAERGELVTITATPDSGYELSKLEVRDSEGRALELREKGDGKYTFTMPQKNVEIEAAFTKEIEIEPTEELSPSESIAPLPALLFRDVPENAYYYEAVLWAVQRGITAGTDGDLFSPNAACTRAQIVTFLWRAAGSPEPAEMSGFADVSADRYYAKAVAWAVENGITSGTDAEHFSPDASCTRAQSVTLLYRALGEGKGGQAAFADVPADSYYADAVAWAAENGVTTGIGGGLFGSEQSCTRAQIVTFLRHAYQKIA